MKRLKLDGGILVKRGDGIVSHIIILLVPVLIHLLDVLLFGGIIFFTARKEY
jgi:hypothetical protein